MTAPYTQYAGHANTTIVVSTSAELNSAIQTLGSTTGGTILVDGSVGQLRLDAHSIKADANSAVLIKSLDPNNPAVFEDVSIFGSSYITLTEIEVQTGPYASVRGSNHEDLRVDSSNHIEIVNNVLTGDATGMFGADPTVAKAENGVEFRFSQDVVFSHNTLSNYYHGIQLAGVTNLTISDNEIFAIQADGIRGGGLTGATISNNYIHDFLGVTYDKDHPDMIQIWAGYPNGWANTDLTISGNILDSGDGPATQSILIQNEAFNRAGDPLQGVYGTNVQVYDNLIHNGHFHGIRVAGYKGVDVHDNTILWNEASGILSTAGGSWSNSVPTVNVVQSVNVVTSDNVAGNVTVNGISQGTGNYFLNYVNENAANYAYDHVMGLSAKGGTTLLDLMFRPDSSLNGTMGSPHSVWQASSDPADATITADTVTGNRMGMELSAKYSTINGQIADPTNTQFVWTFADGTVMHGQTVQVGFSTAGSHSVQLDIIGPNGQTDSTTKLVTVGTSELFETDFNQGGADQSVWASAINVVDSGSAWSKAGAFYLDGASRFDITKANDQFDFVDTMSIDLQFQPTSLSTGDGWLVKYHNGLNLRVLDNGGLRADITTSDGNFTLTTSPGVVGIGQWSDISVNFDGPGGVMEIVVDNNVVGQISVSGRIGDTANGLSLGNPWGKSAEGFVDDLVITTPPSSAFATAVITPNPGSNQSPTLTNGSMMAKEDGTIVTFDLSSLGDDADSDDDGSTLTYSISLAPSEGTAFITGTNLSFDPASDFQDLGVGETRDVQIELTATDSHGLSAKQNFTVQVIGSNDVPVLSVGVLTANIDGTAITFDLADAGTDADNDDDGSSLKYAISRAPPEGNTSIAGTIFSFDPGSDFDDLAAGATREVLVEITATDAHGATMNDIVTITVTGNSIEPSAAPKTPVANLFKGSKVGDKIVGSDHDDVIRGLAGRDKLHGADGEDRLYGNGDNDRLLGGNGNDFLSGGKGKDKLWGDGGDDSMRGGGGNDKLWGGNGNDVMLGGRSKDKLWGDDGADIINGGKDKDWIFGGSGNDSLSGGHGPDILFGGPGDDLLSGGPGSDVFIFDDDSGVNIIVDFDTGDKREVIDLRSVTQIADWSDLAYSHLSQSSGGVTVDLGVGNEILIANIQIEELESTNFLL